MRTEETRNWQKTYTYKLSAGESRTISEEYVIFDRSGRLLRVSIGIPEKLKVKGEPEPKVEVFQRLVFPTNARKVYLDPTNRTFHFWIFDRTIGALKQKASEAKVRKDQVSENERQELRDLLKLSLVEMARWKASGHAMPSFTLLGRIGNLSEEEIQKAWSTGNRESLIEMILERVRAK